MPRECKLIRYCIRDARIRESVLNSVIGNRYYAPVKGGGEGWRRKKKKEKGRDDPWLVFGRPFPLPLGLLSKAFRREAKIGERF